MLDRMKTINKIIIDNHKIKDIPDRENIKIKENIKREEENNDNSFHQLLSLQLCIQKHSGLKELCKILIYII